jgi:hypothetical protein
LKRIRKEEAEDTRGDRYVCNFFNQSSKSANPAEKYTYANPNQNMINNWDNGSLKTRSVQNKIKLIPIIKLNKSPIT